jgi:hypothetical protein
MVASAPAFQAATHWLNPLPPGPILKSLLALVSPGTGRRGTRATRSVAELPKTVILEFFNDLISGSSFQ